MTGDRTYTWVSGLLCCAHYPRGSSRWHGHTYEIRAWWPAGQDAVDLKDRLQRVLKLYDHRGLGANESTGEQLARLVGEQLSGCVRVDVERRLEGFGAVWYRGDA